MKHMLTLLIGLLLFTPSAHAGWFTKVPDPLDEAKEKITLLENQITAQCESLNRWQIATGSLGIGCVLIFVIGTALGASTRKQHHASTTSPRRMGPTSLNGRKSNHLGKATEDDVPSALAA